MTRAAASTDPFSLPALCQLCVFVQVDTNSAAGEKTPANPTGSQPTGDQGVLNKYKLPDELDLDGGAGEVSGAGNGTLMKSAEKSPGLFKHGTMETKASQVCTGYLMRGCGCRA